MLEFEEVFYILESSRWGLIVILCSLPTPPLTADIFQEIRIWNTMPSSFMRAKQIAPFNGLLMPGSPFRTTWHHCSCCSWLQQGWHLTLGGQQPKRWLAGRALSKIMLSTSQCLPEPIECVPSVSELYRKRRQRQYSSKRVKRLPEIRHKTEAKNNQKPRANTSFE